MDKEFEKAVFHLVSQIPPGWVTTYGRLAVMAGSPGRARQVGRVLRWAPDTLPCHRVVNSKGRLAPGFAAQKERLLAEGVPFRGNGCVDMKKHLL